MSTQGHSGHGGHGGSGQATPGHHGNHGHHGHSGGGNAIGGGGLQQTWNSVIKETRFSGEMFRNPLVPLMIYGMVFLSIMLIICLADNNLLDFAVQQHNEAQKKRMQEAAAQQMKADEAALGQGGATQESPQAANQEISQQPQQQQQLQQQFDQQLSPAQNFPDAVGQPNQANLVQQPSFASPPSAQPGYLQQSLNRQSSGGGFSQPNAQYSQQNYGNYGSSGAYSPYAAAPQMGYSQQGYAGSAEMQPMGMSNQFARGGYHAAGSQRSGAYMQGGFKTGPDGVSQVPMNRMVINR